MAVLALEFERERVLTCGFICRDYAGRTIELQHSNWEKHQPRHPEVVAYHNELRLVVELPDAVIETADEQRHYYRRGLGVGKYQICTFALWSGPLMAVSERHISYGQ